MKSIILIQIAIYLISIQLIQSNPTLITNGNGNFEMSDGTKYDKCEEYLDAIGNQTKQNGYYETNNNKIYCFMDFTFRGINNVYQGMLIRADGSIDFNMTWEESKVYRGNNQEMWIGMQDLHNKCGASQTCEAILTMQIIAGPYADEKNQVIYVQDFWIDDESNNWTLHMDGPYTETDIYIPSLMFHNGKPWTTKDRDNDSHSQNCAIIRPGPDWFGGCYRNHPFGDYDGPDEYGLCYIGADSKGNHSGAQCDNLSYYVYGLRDFNTGDIVEKVKGTYYNGSSWQNCDNSVCARCFQSATNCLLNCNTNCGSSGCDTEGLCSDCIDGYFLDQDECKQCDNTKCATCSDISTCIISCDAECVTCNPDETCNSCIDGYFINSSSKCDQCDNQICATCNTNPTTCDIDCDSNCGDQGCATSGRCLNCMDGYYLSDNNICQQCDNTKCATCNTTETQCIIECDIGCTTCNPDETCDQCKDGYYKNGSDKCIQCDNSICATCTTDATTCIQNCDSDCGNQGCQASGKCINCEDTYYLDQSKTCQKCDIQKCYTCQNDSKTCILQCDNNCGDQGCDSQGKCLNCQKGYVLFENSCQICASQCEECTINPFNCTVCAGQSLQPDIVRNTPSCTCPSNYYLNEQSKFCEICPVYCQECQNFNKCILCYQSVTRADNDTCSCNEGYYQLQNQIEKECIECPPKCSSCIDSDTCLKCSNSNFQLPSCTKEIIQQRGMFSVITESGSVSYEQCSQNCATCEQSISNCTSCLGDNRDFKKQCTCKQGYHDENSQVKNCMKCQISCKTCNSSKKCLTCLDENKYVSKINGKCECKQGFIENSNNQCSKCYYLQGKCIQKCPKNYYTDKQTLNCIELQYSLQQQTGVIYIVGLIVLVSIALIKIILCKGVQISKIINNNTNIKPTQNNQDYDKVSNSEQKL